MNDGPTITATSPRYRVEIQPLACGWFRAWVSVERRGGRATVMHSEMPCPLVAAWWAYGVARFHVGGEMMA